jgi:hypothetical protein
MPYEKLIHFYIQKNITKKNCMFSNHKEKYEKLIHFYIQKNITKKNCMFSNHKEKIPKSHTLLKNIASFSFPIQ